MKLKEFRVKKGLTQEQVAREIGIPRTKYARYENGQHNPTKEMLKILADFFHTTTDALLGHEVPYLLDKSLLSDEQNKVIEKVMKLSDLECTKVEAYIEGLKN